jgi:hypothetical protein
MTLDDLKSKKSAIFFRNHPNIDRLGWSGTSALARRMDP